MGIQKVSFGKIGEKSIEKYTLENNNGMEVSIITYGATISSIKLPTKEGKVEIACGFDTIEGYFGEEYLANAPYFGCTVGRVASIIKDSSFSLNGKNYELNANAGSDQLHGGPNAFDKQIWKATEKDGNLELSIFSPDGENGFPGNVEIKVTFSLDDKNALSIKYEGTTDQDTPISLTNHTYFNLNGFTNKIDYHQVEIQSSSALETDENFAPIGKKFDLAGTTIDFQKPKLLKTVFDKVPTGCLQYYLFDNSEPKLSKVAQIEDTESGRKMEVLTTEPGMLLYTGYFTSDKLARKSEEQYGSLRAFCCETSRVPNSINSAEFEGIITKAGETYKSETVYRFLV